MRNFGFNGIPDVISQKEVTSQKAQDYLVQKKRERKPLFVVSTRKRPNQSGKKTLLLVLHF